MKQFALAFVVLGLMFVAADQAAAQRIRSRSITTQVITAPRVGVTVQTPRRIAAPSVVVAPNRVIVAPTIRRPTVVAPTISRPTINRRVNVSPGGVFFSGPRVSVSVGF